VAYAVEQECPQCGAPIGLEETDHLLQCPYCSVKSFLFAHDYYRLVLPHNAPDKEIIYAPYLRFKGNVYSCQGQTIGHRIVDITHVGTSVKGLPISLGLRPQAMKMKFVSKDTVGSFLRSSLGVADVLARVGKQVSGSGQLFHRAYIGETVSLIYLPLYVEKETLFDAILNRPIVKLSQSDEGLESAAMSHTKWRLIFMSTLCPQCGWNLEGERDSVVLTCSNCNTAWEALEESFSRVGLAVVPEEGKKIVYLPFWRITASAKGIEINSFADFIRVTNQPKVVQKEWENQDMSYWCPAFKIIPTIFVRLITQLTTTPKDFKTEETVPRQGLYPVTMPQSEAVQSMKLTLAGSALTKKTTFPLLPEVDFAVKDSTLVYLPFEDKGHDFVQQRMHLSINKKALEYGRHR
jgi:ssDNA-binding Zn-finger/Zn-ribbon topoisomerase 1